MSHFTTIETQVRDIPALREARRKGYTTRRQQLGDGSIKLTIGGI
jgi:hypothetical protein